MAEKILKTRIQLRYDTLTNWTTNNPVLKAGEIAVATIPTPAPANKQLPPVMFKVGDGTSKFNALDWASALAADVYDWAKKSGLPVENSGSGKVVTNIEWKVTATHPNGALVITKGNLTASDVGVNEDNFPGLKKVGTVTGVKMNSGTAKTPDAYGVVDLGTVITAHQDISGKQNKIKAGTHISIGTDGVTINAAWPTDSDTGYAGIDKTGTVTGINMNGVSKGTSGVVDLGTVLTDASKFDAAGAAAAVLGESTDAATANTVYGAKKAATNAQTTIDNYKTSNDTALAAVKATAEAAQTATQVDTKISNHNSSTTAHNDIRQSITALAEKVSGRATGYVFKNKTDADYTTAIGKAGSFVVGDTIYFTDANISDQWVTAVNSTSPYYTFQNIETEKTNLTGYVKGTSLTTDKIILGNAGSNIKASTYGISTSVTANDNANVPTSGAVSTELNKKQNKLSQDQLDAANSGITADKVGTYDGYATTIAGKQNALSTDQLKAVNSGITDALVTKYNGYETSKQDKITTTNKLAASLVSGLATVATSGSYNDLTNKPTIPTMPTVHNAALKDTSGQTIFTADASEDVTITVINCGTSADTW